MATTAGSCPPPQPQNGFQVHTTELTILNNTPLFPERDKAGATVTCRFLFFVGSPQTGTVGSFNGTSNSSGRFNVDNAKLPATWEFINTNGPCAGQVFFGSVAVGDVVGLRCSIFITGFQIAPAYVDVNSPPATFSMTGSGMSTSYGMPQIVFLNRYGYAVATTAASAVSPVGSWLQAPAPNMSLMQSGIYPVLVKNVMPSGLLETIGGAWMDVYGNDPPPPPDPCGGVLPCT